MNRHDLWKIIYNGTPRMHATGFAQLYLADGVRLHVWSDKLFKRAPDVTQIAFFHDHRYGIKSAVLRGVLLDSPADYINTGFGDWDIWEVRPAHEGEAEKPCSTESSVNIHLSRPRIIPAGQGYEIGKRTFHATRALEPTVTVMRKLDEEPAWARLLVPHGFDPVHSLIQQPSDTDLKMMMWETCANLPTAALAKIEEMIGEAYRAH